MFILLLTSLLAIHSFAVPIDSAIGSTELVFAFMIHRHGDRTPNSKSNVKLSNDPAALHEASELYGYGQLTDVGKQRAYALGQFIRQRYGCLLSPKFNRSEMYVRSTDYTRAKMTALSAMAAVYPSVEPRWSDSVHWEPVPYTVVPTKYDFNQALLNCPVFTSKFYATMKESPESMVPHTALLKELSAILGFEVPIFEMMPVGSSYAVNDLLDSQVSLGVPLTPELEVLRPQLAELAAIALHEILGDEEFFSLQSGPLLHEFLENSAKVIAGVDTQKVRVYSGHDLNVYALETALQLKPKQGVPPYAAILSLELRKNIKTGDFSVLPVYVASPGEKPIYLQVEGCEGILCSYDQFHHITSKIAVDEDTWRSKCGWTSDLEIDDSDIV